MGSSFKLQEAGSPFPLPPRPKVRLSFPFLGGLFKGPETEGTGPGRLSYAPHTGWTLRETFPSPWPEGVLRGSLGPAGGAGAGGGNLGIPFGARCGSASDRPSALPARQG